MDTYISLNEAAEFAHVSEKALNELVQNGRIKAVMLSTGEMVLRKKDITPRVSVKEMEEYQEFASLAGKPISLSEAERQYNVPYQTISRWAQRGMIDKLGVDGRATLVDHAQVATLAKVYHASGGGQGKWIFHKGSPYSKKG